MTDTTYALSPAAKYELDRLGRAAAAGGNWYPDYMATLQKLAERDTSDVTDWEIKGQGIDILEKSREEHRVAVELKAYALIFFCSAEQCAAIAKLPESASLDDFLDRLMPNTGKTVRHDRLLRFLAHEAEERVDIQMMLHPRKLTRDERIAAMARGRLEGYEYADLPQQSQYWLQEEFRTWWKTQEDGNPLAKTNKAKAVSVSERRKALIKLLPTQKAPKGFSSWEWEKAATDARLFSSRTTFGRDTRALVAGRLVHKQRNGSFRQLSGRK